MRDKKTIEERIDEVIGDQIVYDLDLMFPDRDRFVGRRRAKKNPSS